MPEPTVLRALGVLALLLASACGAGQATTPAPPAGAPPEAAPIDDDLVEGDGPPVVIEGRVRYERLVLSQLGLGPALETRPAPYVDVQLRGANDGPCYAQTSADGDGAFAATVRAPDGSALRMWVLARTRYDPVRDLVVHHGVAPADGDHQDLDVFFHASEPFDPATTTTVDLVVPYRRDGPEDRPSIGFGILDVLGRCDGYVRAAAGGTLPPCHAYTRVGNNGAIGTSFYDPVRGAINILGGAAGNPDGSDTDYFDDAVIAHEYGHFVEVNLVHTLSRAGEHGAGLVEPPLAWSEGQATAFGCLCRGDSRYVDTLTTTGGAQFDTDIESAPHLDKGIGSEETVADVLWDLGDGAGSIADADGDGVGVPLERLYAAFLSFDPVWDAPYLGLFLQRLVDRGDADPGALSGLLAFPEPRGVAFPLEGNDVWPAPLAPLDVVTDVVDATGANPCRAQEASRWYALDFAAPATLDVALDSLPVAGSGDGLEIALLSVDGRVLERRLADGGATVRLGPMAFGPGRWIVRVSADCSGSGSRVGYRLTVGQGP